jgi:hypothetical protein
MLKALAASAFAAACLLALYGYGLPGLVALIAIACASGAVWLAAKIAPHPWQDR